MEQIGKMTLLEHIACAMEDLNNEDFCEDKKKAQLLIDKARGISELAATYNEAIKIQQEEKRIMLSAFKLCKQMNLTPTEMNNFISGKTQAIENEKL